MSTPSFTVQVENPLLRTPLALIIDDSCPVINKARYWIEQRHQWRMAHEPEAPPLGWEQHYDKLDRMPVTVPAAFARRWGEWCAEEGIRGKFSMIPFPAGVGRIDTGFPGFPSRELDEWLEVTHEVLHPQFDLTPEMLTHTRVVDLDTWQLTEEWEQGKWVDPPLERLTEYIATAMQLLKNVGISCEGVTSPGAFGSKQEEAYAQAVLDASREVAGNPRPFYFLTLTHDRMPDVPIRHTQPDRGAAIASIVGCAGDWFGATGFDVADPDLFITQDLEGGRLPGVLAAGAPCVLVGHWPCFSVNQEIGFGVLRTVKRRLDAYDPDRIRTIWMKTSEIAHYQMARELSIISVTGPEVRITTQFPTSLFTVSVDIEARGVTVQGRDLREVRSRGDFSEGTFLVEGGRTSAGFDLEVGETIVAVTR